MVRRAHLPSLQVCQDLAQQRRRDPERPLEPFRLKWNRSRHFAGSWTRGAKMRQKSNSNTLSSEEIRQKASAEQPGSATRPRRRTTTHRTRARRGLGLNGGAPSTAAAITGAAGGDKPTWRSAAIHASRRAGSTPRRSASTATPSCVRTGAGPLPPAPRSSPVCYPSAARATPTEGLASPTRIGRILAGCVLGPPAVEHQVVASWRSR